MKATDFCKYFDFTLWVNDTNEEDEFGNATKYFATDDQECFKPRYIDDVRELSDCFDSMLIDYVDRELYYYGFQYNSDSDKAFYEQAKEWIENTINNPLFDSYTYEVICCLINPDNIINDLAPKEKTMLDFEKLNAMIDEVNNVIADVENETADIKNKVHDSIALAYDYVCDELVKYCKILNKACSSSLDKTYRNIKASFEIPIQNTDGKFKFTYEYPDYSFDVKVLADEDDDGNWKGYKIVRTGRNGYINMESYEAVNRSCPSIKWLLQICDDWNSYKSEVENAVVNAVNDILKQKSKFAHEDNIKEKLALEKVKGRAEEIYAEFDKC